MLHAQGFWSRNGVPNDITELDTPEGRHLVPLIRTYTVRVEGEIGSQGVGDKGALFTSDDHSPFLEGGQPVDDVGRDGVVAEQSGHRDHVLVPATGAEGRNGGYSLVSLAGQPRREVDVVSGQVHDYADICDTARERALASRGDLQNAPELARGNAFACFLQAGVVSLDMADGTYQSGRCKGRCKRPGFRGRWRQWLLDQRMNTVLYEQETDFLVESRRRRDDGVVDPPGYETQEVRFDLDPSDDLARAGRIGDTY